MTASSSSLALGIAPHRRPRTALYLLVACVLWYYLVDAVLTSRILGADYTLVGLIVRLQAIPPGLLIIGLLLLELFRKQPKFADYEVCLLLLPIPVAVSLGVGLLYGNSLYFVLGDAFKGLFPALFYFAARAIVKQPKTWDLLFNVMLGAGLAYNTTALGVQLFNFFVLGRVTLGGVIDHVVLIYALHHYMNSKEKRGLCLIAIGISASSAVLTLERREWLSLAVIVLLVVLTSRKLALLFTSVRLIAVGLCVVLVGTAVMPQTLKAVGGIVQRRIEYTLNAESGIDRSSWTRIAELESVWGRIRQDGGWWTLLTGMGSGAEFERLDELARVTAEAGKDGGGSRIGWVHQIHNTYASVVFRYGGIALLLLCVGFLFVVLNAWRFLGCMVGSDKLKVLAILTAVVVDLGISWNVVNGLGDFRVYILLGMLGAKLVHQRAQQHPGHTLERIC